MIQYGYASGINISGIDSYTKLMLHMDGEDSSTTFTDSSLSAKTVTRYGDAQIDTAQYKFGRASGLFDGNGDYLTVPDSDDWYFGTGDFTVDFWTRFNSVAACAFYWHYASGTGDGKGRVNIDYNLGNFRFNSVNSSGTWIADYEYTWTPIALQWYHVVIVRSGSDLNLYIDGIKVTWTIINVALGSTMLPNIAADLQIGVNFNGWLDEFRVSKGIARWTSNFTPPMFPYTR
jgi:hypothetical protein